MSSVQSSTEWPDQMERRGLMDALDKAHAIIWFNPQGGVVDGNENALDLFGLSAEAFLNSDYFGLCGTSRTTNLAERREWARIVTGASVHTEREFVAAGARRIWSSVVYAAIKRDDGSTRRVIAILVDLSRLAWKPGRPERII